MKRIITTIFFFFISLNLWALEGTFIIGSDNADFPNVQSAFEALQNEGNTDTVTFIIQTGEYGLDLDLNTTIEHPVIVKSEAQDPNTVSIDMRLNVSECSLYFFNVHLFSEPELRYLKSIGNNNFLYLENCSTIGGWIEGFHVEIRNCDYTGAIENTVTNIKIYDSNFTGTIALGANGIEGQKEIYLENNVFQPQENNDSPYIIIINGEHVEGSIHKNVFHNYIIDADVTGDDSSLLIEENLFTANFNNTCIKLENIACEIKRNKIIGYGSGIDLTKYVYDLPIVVQNNFISTNFSSLEVNVRGNISIYNNSIFTKNTQAAIFYVMDSPLLDSPQLFNYNNILVNQSGILQEFLVDLPGLEIEDLSSHFSIDNNVYWHTSELTEQKIYLDFDYSSTFNLAEAQSLLGVDANSIFVNPEFTSETDLHINNPALFDAGIPLAEVTIDIDGDPRDETPSIGADEYIESTPQESMIQLRFETTEACDSSFDATIQIKSNQLDSILQIGTSSILVEYNEQALGFVNYTSLNFDGSDSCALEMFPAWEGHAYDATVLGKFNLVYSLSNSLLEFSCPEINGTEWIDVGKITFQLIDNAQDLMLGFSSDPSTVIFNSNIPNDGTNAIPVDFASMEIVNSVQPCSPINNDPIAINDTISVFNNNSITISVLNNDYDPDGDALLICVTSTQNGLVTISGNVLIYTPNSEFVGTDSLTYTICDGNGGSAQATVYITVNSSEQCQVNNPFEELDWFPNASSGGLSIVQYNDTLGNAFFLIEWCFEGIDGPAYYLYDCSGNIVCVENNTATNCMDWFDELTFVNFYWSGYTSSTLSPSCMTFDCNQVPFGTATLDNCGNCLSPTNPDFDSCIYYEANIPIVCKDTLTFYQLQAPIEGYSFPQIENYEGDLSVSLIDDNCWPCVDSVTIVMETWEPFEFEGTDTISIVWFNESYSDFAIQKLVVNIQEECGVWPGDVNNDGIANNEDLIYLGMKIGTEGGARYNASTDWIGQDVFDWDDWQNDGINTKFADCDGDGSVYFSDKFAISQNYGLTHTVGKKESTGVPLSAILPDTIWTGEPLEIPIILGSETDPVEDFYGIAFSIEFDPTLVEEGSITFDFSSDFLGIEDQEVIGLDKVFFESGVVELGVSKTDMLNTNGYGQIATMSLVMIDDIIGKNEGAVLPFSLGFTNITSLGIEGNKVEVGTATVESEIFIGIENEGITEKEILIYPNPTSNVLQIRMSDKEEYTLKLRDSQGKLLIHQQQIVSDQLKLDVSSFANGIYFLELQSKYHSITQKIQIMN